MIHSSLAAVRIELPFLIVMNRQMELQIQRNAQKRWVALYYIRFDPTLNAPQSIHQESPYLKESGSPHVLRDDSAS